MHSIRFTGKQVISMLASFTLVLIPAGVAAQNNASIEPQDTAAAINNPDSYAWRLFIAINWPADVANRKADPTRKFGENATTVWESWKLSSGKNDEVFLSDGKDPGTWLEGTKASDQRMNDLERLPLQQQIRLGTAKIRFDPGTSAAQRNENHLNEATYNFIR